MTLKTGILNFVAVNASKLAGFKSTLYYISFYQNIQTGPGTFYLASYLVRTGDVSLGLNRPKHEFYHSPPTGAGVKIA